MFTFQTQSNYYIIKSIYLNYKAYNRVENRSRGMINSSVNQNSVKRNQVVQTYTFQFTSQGPLTTIKMSIDGLVDIYNDNLLDWISRFRHISEIFHWSDENTVAILRASIPLYINSIIQSRQTLDTCLDQLANTKYPSGDRFKYDKKLASLKQE